MRAWLIIFVLLASVLSPAKAGEAFRLQGAIGGPQWFSVSGVSRARYESLDGQFRAGLTGSDQALFFRTFLHLKADAGPVVFGVEFQDSRAYLTDSGTPLSTSFVNPFDILQAYAKFESPGVFGAGSRGEITVGRQTISIGSKRQIERASFANVIKSYTGIHAVSYAARDDELHIFLVAPVGREPGERIRIDRNAFELDREQLGRRIWGVHYRRADAMPWLGERVWAEAFLYGLNEEDTGRTPTPNRSYLAPGFRLYLAPAEGAWDIDIEGALRFGARRATSAPADNDEQDVAASMLIARAGYTFNHPWRPRIALQYYWASGDDDPFDDEFGQHERLFGSRRTDLNNTSLHGPLAPANLSAPGVRMDIKPSKRADARLHYSAAFLASETDAWVIAKLRDPAGASGSFIGHTIDMRTRYWLVPDSLQLEFGASVLIFGEFAKTAPQGPQGTRTLFAYGQVEFAF